MKENRQDNKQKKFEYLRKEIDNIDNEIIRLLNKRLEIAKKIGIIKEYNNSAIFKPERENKILDKLLQYNKIYNGLLSENYLNEIYKNIIKSSRSIQGSLQFFHAEDYKNNVLNNTLIEIFGENIKLSSINNYKNNENITLNRLQSILKDNPNNLGILKKAQYYHLIDDSYKNIFSTNKLMTDFQVILELIVNKEIFYLLSCSNSPETTSINTDITDNPEKNLILAHTIDIDNNIYNELYNELDLFLSRKNIYNNIKETLNHIKIILISDEINEETKNNIIYIFKKYKINVKILGYYIKSYYFN
ncbi:MAG: chorismate mutase [bacterium]